MAKEFHVICTLANASNNINGVDFKPHNEKHVRTAAPVSEEVANYFAKIPGYHVEPVEEAKVETKAERKAREAAERKAAEEAAEAEKKSADEAAAKVAAESGDKKDEESKPEIKPEEGKLV